MKIDLKPTGNRIFHAISLSLILDLIFIVVYIYLGSQLFRFSEILFSSVNVIVFLMVLFYFYLIGPKFNNRLRSRVLWGWLLVLVAGLIFFWIDYSFNIYPIGGIRESPLGLFVGGFGILVLIVGIIVLLSSVKIFGDESTSGKRKVVKKGGLEFVEESK